MTPIDDIVLRFDQTNLILLNVVIGFIMFGVALDMKVDDFRQVLTSRRAVFIGLCTQFVLLPALTFLLVCLINPAPSIALGMILVAACPGGNVSNCITYLARGNTALSVTMSSVSTACATVMTPLNLTFWGSLHPGASTILQKVVLNPWDLFITVLVILGIPLAIGMSVAHYYPKFAQRSKGVTKLLSMIFFVSFVTLALAANFDYFLRFIGAIAGVVFLHNALAISLGYFAARAVKLEEADRRAVAIEVGIQNSALGLILVFDFFDGLGGMAIIAAWWGIWHIISGLSIAWFWGKRDPQKGEEQ